jgi:MFS family permease
VATIWTGLANGVAILFIARVFLGLGEGATFPTATKAMTIWLPVRKRAFAQGITHSFSRLGSAITPPLVGYMMIAYGWRMPFYLLGAISLAWALQKDTPGDGSRLLLWLDTVGLSDMATVLPGSVVPPPHQKIRLVHRWRPACWHDRRYGGRTSL